MLPCLGGDCGDGVIDEVFMGTAQSCMELYRMKPPATTSNSTSEGKPWQDLLVRGDQLLKELQTQDKWGGGDGKATVGPGSSGKSQDVARTVVASAAEMVDAISKLADVLGAGQAKVPASTQVRRKTDNCFCMKQVDCLLMRIKYL